MDRADWRRDGRCELCARRRRDYSCVFLSSILFFFPPLSPSRCLDRKNHFETLPSQCDATFPSRVVEMGVSAGTIAFMAAMRVVEPVARAPRGPGAGAASPTRSSRAPRPVLAGGHCVRCQLPTRLSSGPTTWASVHLLGPGRVGGCRAALAAECLVETVYLPVQYLQLGRSWHEHSSIHRLSWVHQSCTEQYDDCPCPRGSAAGATCAVPRVVLPR